MAVFNVAAFRDIEAFKSEVTEFAQYLKSSPPAAGFNEVFYPESWSTSALSSFCRMESTSKMHLGEAPRPGLRVRPGRQPLNAVAEGSPLKDYEKVPDVQA